MVVRMRATRSKRGMRRSHHAIKGMRLSKCACGSLHVAHTACKECGMYNGKVAIDVVARTARNVKRVQRKLGTTPVASK